MKFTIVFAASAAALAVGLALPAAAHDDARCAANLDKIQARAAGVDQKSAKLRARADEFLRKGALAKHEKAEARANKKADIARLLQEKADKQAEICAIPHPHPAGSAEKENLSRLRGEKRDIQGAIRVRRARD